MEALSNYLSSIPSISSRIFVSNPPGPALLIWTNKDFLPNISGISIVEQEDASETNGIKSQELMQILKTQLFGTVPLLHIVYNADMTRITINEQILDLASAADLISKTFSIGLGSNPAKAPNDVSQIADPFHVWSRNAFDGYNVMKTDIDFLLTRDGRISSIWEVKRSAKIRVGTWAPYVNPTAGNDINNYFMLMSLSDLLKAQMITVHHSIMDPLASLSANDSVDLYFYKPSPNQETLNNFAVRKVSTTKTLKDAFNL